MVGDPRPSPAGAAAVAESVENEMIAGVHGDKSEAALKNASAKLVSIFAFKDLMQQRKGGPPGEGGKYNPHFDEVAKSTLSLKVMVGAGTVCVFQVGPTAGGSAACACWSDAQPEEPLMCLLVRRTA